MAELIQMELGDPRLGMVTVTAVDVTREFESARVFFTVLGKELSDKSQIEETTATLNHAAGFLRSALAKRLKLRTTPKLIFVYDSSMEHGNKLTDLIKSAVTKPTDNKSEDS
jgi:ribosome-binding factor A